MFTGENLSSTIEWWNNAEAIIFENKLIGFVATRSETDYAVSSTADDRPHWAGKFEDKQEAINHIIARYKEVQWNALHVVTEGITPINPYYVNKVLYILRKREFHPQSIYIQNLSNDSKKVLIFLPLEEYISDRFYGVYTEVTEFEQKSNIVFSFTALGERIDHDLLNTDGYINADKEYLTK